MIEVVSASHLQLNHRHHHQTNELADRQLSAMEDGREDGAGGGCGGEVDDEDDDDDDDLCDLIS